MPFPLQAPAEKKRLEALLVDNVNEIEKFTRPFYEWVELAGGRLVNGLARSTTASAAAVDAALKPAHDKSGEVVRGGDRARARSVRLRREVTSSIKPFDCTTATRQRPMQSIYDKTTETGWDFKFLDFASGQYESEFFLDKSKFGGFSGQ